MFYDLGQDVVGLGSHILLSSGNGVCVSHAALRPVPWQELQVPFSLLVSPGLPAWEIEQDFWDAMCRPCTLGVPWSCTFFSEGPCP